jgi:hypothetical protein
LLVVVAQLLMSIFFPSFPHFTDGLPPIEDLILWSYPDSW